MAIIRDQPPPSSMKGSKPPETVIYEKEARAPRGRKAVYIDTLTYGRLIQAAAELGRNVNDMAEAALIEHLRREAVSLFEREFEAADKASQTSIPRWEFEKNWRTPAWSRGQE